MSRLPEDFSHRQIGRLGRIGTVWIATKPETELAEICRNNRLEYCSRHAYACFEQIDVPKFVLKLLKYGKKKYRDFGRGRMKYLLKLTLRKFAAREKLKLPNSNSVFFDKTVDEILHFS